MYSPCKVFISSVYTTQLADVRQQIKASLKKASHIPLMFEDGTSFGPWQEDKIQQCLDKVKESNIFLLLLNGEKGGMAPKDKALSPTYVEFRHAVADNKIILAFVEKDYKDYFFSKLLHICNDQLDKHIQEHHREPQYIENVVKEAINIARNSPTATHYDEQMLNPDFVDPFAWTFIYEAYRKTNWIYSFPLTRTAELCENINEHLSHFLSLYCKMEMSYHQVQDALQTAGELWRHQAFVNSLHETFQNGEWKIMKFLRVLQRYAKGGRIFENSSPYMHDVVNELNPCNAITLYYRHGDLLRLYESIGANSVEEEYPIDDEYSYVAQTYLDGNKVLAFDEKKQVLYYLCKSGEFVLSMHFPLVGEDWTNENVEAYSEEIFQLFIADEFRLCYNTALTLIRGMKA